MGTALLESEIGVGNLITSLLLHKTFNDPLWIVHYTKFGVRKITLKLSCPVCGTHGVLMTKSTITKIAGKNTDTKNGTSTIIDRKEPNRDGVTYLRNILNYQRSKKQLRKKLHKISIPHKKLHKISTDQKRLNLASIIK